MKATHKTGGSFRVSGAGDGSGVVAFMAVRGEAVTVRTPAQERRK